MFRAARSSDAVLAGLPVKVAVVVADRVERNERRTGRGCLGVENSSKVCVHAAA